MDESRFDTPYEWGFYQDLNPVFLNYVCTVGGHPVRPLADGFTYCALGCRNGATVIGLAHLFPGGRFTAIDANPDYIRNIRKISGDEALDNLTVLEMDFAGLADAELPSFDFVVLHGVVSRIGPDERNHIREFLAAKVKTGGIVYVSYNCLPGWSAFLPIADLILQHTAGLTDNAAFKAQAEDRHDTAVLHQ